MHYNNNDNNNYNNYNNNNKNNNCYYLLCSTLLHCYCYSAKFNPWPYGVSNAFAMNSVHVKM